MKLPPPLPWGVRTAPERLILVFTAAASLVGALLLAAHDYGPGLSTCTMQGLIGLPCAGCGGTRAISMLVHGDMASAMAMNPAAVIAVVSVLLLAAYAAFVLVLRLEPIRPAFLRSKFSRLALFGLLGANWIYLLLAGCV